MLRLVLPLHGAQHCGLSQDIGLWPDHRDLTTTPGLILSWDSCLSLGKDQYWGGRKRPRSPSSWLPHPTDLGLVVLSPLPCVCSMTTVPPDPCISHKMGLADRVPLTPLMGKLRPAEGAGLLCLQHFLDF